MKFLVVNGSPKGQKSVTLQYVKYLEKCFTKDEFCVLTVAQQIRAYEAQTKLDEFKTALSSCDCVVIAYPVYTFLAPAQLHRFFEILLENNVSFDEKYVTQLSTSKRFYDVTAHSAIKAEIQQLGGRYLKGLSCDMEDLTSKVGGKDLVAWFKFSKYKMQNNICDNTYQPTPATITTYQRQAVAVEKTIDKRVLVVTDSKNNQSLDNMVDDFISLMPCQVDVLNLYDINFKSGCLGCLKCTDTGHCVIKDGFEELLNQKINKYDAIVSAMTITNHTLSSRYKMFYDRQFVNGHRPVTTGQPTGYIVSGNLSIEGNMQEYIDAKSAVGGNYNCGVACDEANTFDDLKTLCARLAYALENGIYTDRNFYEVGGLHIFGNLIWVMRGIMKLDYKFFKQRDMFDLPTKKRKTMLAMKLVGAIKRSKAINKKMPNIIDEGMLLGYQKAIEKATPIE